ncbi:LysE family translocator [Bailinhaonella thermotolerans]|uniref:LysE family translocator n=1 Tax=Bailinhaonella thermotolerans TaxID=1070861 RepID=UPI00192A296E|nr:LysE family transporter [Bailinhaonella thermotolerans]
MEILLSSAVFGIAYCLPPGPVNTEALRLGVQHGPRHAWNLLVGSLAGDALWAAVALTAGSLLASSVPLRIVLGVTGVAFLAVMAFSAGRAALRPAPAAALGVPPSRALRTGAVLSVATPLALPFWLGVSAQLPAADPVRSAVFFAGFLAGAVAYSALWTLLTTAGARLRSPGLLRAINVTASAALSYFAVRLTLDTWSLVA